MATLWSGKRPTRLAANSIVVLQPYGSLFFAGASVLESNLPDPKDAAGATLIIRLRGLPQGGSTLVSVVERYAKKLHNNGAHLVLTELSDRIYEQLDEDRDDRADRDRSGLSRRAGIFRGHAQGGAGRAETERCKLVKSRMILYAGRNSARQTA